MVPMQRDAETENRKGEIHMKQDTKEKERIRKIKEQATGNATKATTKTENETKYSKIENTESCKFRKQQAKQKMREQI
jgi:hypothetical protein